MPKPTKKQGVSKLSRRKAVKKILIGAASLITAKFAASQGRPPARPPDRPRPNILIFITDDQRYDAMSCAGNPILKTPNMDRIAARGVRFTEAFVTNSLCAPSRASILTGQYSHVHGVLHNPDGAGLPGAAGLQPYQLTFPLMLQRANYWTALVGKWHLAGDPAGFVQYAALPGQGDYLDPEMLVNGARIKFRGHVSDVIGDQAIQFLENRPKEKPFCMFVNSKAPHALWIPAPRFMKYFEDVTVPEPRTFSDTLQGRSEAVRKAGLSIASMTEFDKRGCPTTLPMTDRKNCNLQALVKNYYRVLLGVDDFVGRVLDYLDQRGLTENTAVIFTSDNGFFLGDHGLYDKRLMYEESIRVPLLISYPAAIPPGQTDLRHMALNIDLAPTALELAGEHVPHWMQGRSLVPLLQRKNVPWRESFLYEYFEYPGFGCVRKNRGVRTARWKFIHFWELPEEFELYNLEKDPLETTNLARDPKHKPVLDQMRAELEKLRKDTDDIDTQAGAAAPCRPS
jgi:arylsulfatase A-like enzyme